MNRVLLRLNALYCRCFHAERVVLTEDRPWYLAEKTVTAEHENPKMPSVANAPPMLKKITEFVTTELNLQDVEIVDRRQEDSPIGPVIMILGTGKSSRHIGKAAQRLSTYIKHEFRTTASKDGVLSANFLRLFQRREQNRLQNKRLPIMERQRPAKVASWVVLDTKLGGIHVHIMDAERRRSLDLENLALRQPSQSSEWKNKKAEKFEAEYLLPASSLASKTIGRGTTRYTNQKMLKRNFCTSALAGSDISYDENKDVRFESFCTEGFLRKLDAMTADLSNSALSSAEKQAAVVKMLSDTEEVQTLAYWQTRLAYCVVAVRLVPNFPLRVILDCVLRQEAMGHPVSTVDIELACSAIAYCGLPDFSQLPFDAENQMRWRSLCDEKTTVVAEIAKHTSLGSENSILTNARLVTLLFRSYVCPAKNSISPSNALEAPQTFVSEQAFYDLRMKPLIDILYNHGILFDSRILITVLCSLLNCRMWDEFWRVLDGTTLVIHLSIEAIEVILAMVVKTGNQAQMTYAIQQFLPRMLLKDNIYITPALAKSLDAGLNHLDPSRQGYSSIRRLITEAVQI